MVARRLPRSVLLWSSAAGTTAGAGLFTVAHTIALTMAGAVLLGFAGTTLLTCIQAVLSDRHGEHRDRALTEANVGAAVCAVLAPLLLGLGQATPLGWRAALGLPALLFAGMYLRYRHEPLPPAPARRPAGHQARLSRSCWLLAALVAVGIAVEFCPIYFGTEALAATGLRTAQAAIAMSGFYLGILGGRVGGVYLTRRGGRTIPLLYASLAVTAAGFGLFWLASPPAPGGRRAVRSAGSAWPTSIPCHWLSPWPPRPGTAISPTPRTRCSAACSSSPPPTARQPRRSPRAARRVHRRAGTHRGVRGPADRRAPAGTA